MKIGINFANGKHTTIRIVKMKCNFECIPSLDKIFFYKCRNFNDFLGGIPKIRSQFYL